MNLIEMTTRFNSDDKCREFMERLRWPLGPECPRCKGTKLSRLDSKLLWCGPCDYQFTVTSGTVFHDSHLPLITWFAATLLLCEAKKGISACQIQRTLGIGGYKTAWHLCHRIRHAMVETDRPMLSGKVEIDETYVGGKARGKGTQFCGRGTEKEPVIGIRQRGGDLRFFHAEEVRTGVLEQFIRENVSEDVEAIFTDDLNMYRGVANRMKLGKKHKIIRHRSSQYVNGDIHTNTVESAFSLLKRGIIGTWHRVSAKHLQSYCTEMAFRFNRRKNSDLFVDTLRHMVTAPVLTFQRLTEDKEQAA
jgi:transposase-like protein